MIDNYIFNFRKRFGWSQRRFAEKSGVSISAIKNWESGKTKIPAWIKLVVAAIAFNLPPYQDHNNK